MPSTHTHDAQAGLIAVTGAGGQQGAATADTLPMQLISSTDIGRIAATILLDPSRITEPVEIATDRLTGPQIAEVFATHAQRTGRFETLPLDALAHTPDLQAMFRWFNTTDSYNADYDTSHALDPDAMDLETWLATTRWPDR